MLGVKLQVEFEFVAGVPADLDPPQNGPPGPNPLANIWTGESIYIR